MNDKLYTLPNTSSMSSSNSLIDENYDDLVLEKITRELGFCSNHQDGSSGLEDSSVNSDKRNIILAKCKGLLGIHFCENINNIPLKLNDNIIIKSDNEFEFACVLGTGRLVGIKRLTMELENEALPAIERLANERDIDRNLNNVVNSFEAKKVFLQYVQELSLDMKLVDIHYQFDRKKLFFFYTSDGRVDFRVLAKKLAGTFKTRIELRQMGVRDEAKRIGGLATCGREFCCTSFINNFKRITTDIAEENNVGSSISKYTGPCGKLKCCLSFEIE